MQIIIIYIILFACVVYSIYALVKYINKKNEACGDCGGCEIKNEITKNAKNKLTHDPNTCGCNPTNKEN